jgi:hypothetical protein
MIIIIVTAVETSNLTQIDFEPTTPVFERAKTFHALDQEATVIDLLFI